MTKHKGVTLIELMVTIVIMGILLALAVPSFNDMFKQHRLIGAAEALVGNLNYAKSESIKRADKVTLSVIRSTASSWCYGLVSGDNCNCTTGNSCYIDLNNDGAVSGGELKTVSSTAFPGIVISSPTAGNTTVKFTAARGTAVTGKTIEFQSDNGLTLQVIVSSYGRIRLCSPTGSGKVSGFEDC